MARPVIELIQLKYALEDFKPDFFFYYIGTYMFLQKSEEKLRKTWKGHYEKIYMSIYNYIRVVIPKEEKGKFNLKARH